MRIAFVSFEYPPETGYGGIGTYVMKAARLLQGRGHSVEVFAAGHSDAITREDSGVLLHRVRGDRHEHFTHAVVGPFSRRHGAAAFDVLESPEYFHEGSAVAAAFPHIPLIVKLHSPSLLLSELQGEVPPAGWKVDLHSYWSQFRRLGRAIWERRGIPRWYWSHWSREFALERDAAECAFAKRADLVASPSLSLLQLMRERWDLNPARLLHVPNPYDAPDALLQIPIETDCSVVSFFGRLEARKGLVQLAKALPRVLERFPRARFRFVGRNGPAPGNAVDFETYLLRAAGRFSDRLEFTGQVSLQETYRYFSLTDVCVFPSIWENFPNVCLEAMAAGRGIVGSRAGGMSEMLIQEESGLLIDPFNIDQMAAAIVTLLEDPAKRMQFGRRARERLLSEYASDTATARLEQSYIMACGFKTKVS